MRAYYVMFWIFNLYTQTIMKNYHKYEVKETFLEEMQLFLKVDIVPFRMYDLFSNMHAHLMFVFNG